jgi:hypothetical protein
MNNNDRILRTTLQKVQRQADGPAPEFDRVFATAAVAAIALLGIGLLPTEKDEFTYVDVEALVATTYWSAPSDFLLPEHQFDIYREVPRLFESTDVSTESDAGALL